MSREFVINGLRQSFVNIVFYTLQGDSGGPLTSGGKLVGIASLGYKCAAGMPDVFTEISSFYKWIHDTTSANPTNWIWGRIKCYVHQENKPENICIPRYWLQKSMLQLKEIERVFVKMKHHGVFYYMCALCTMHITLECEIQKNTGIGRHRVDEQKCRLWSRSTFTFFNTLRSVQFLFRLSFCILMATLNLTEIEMLALFCIDSKKIIRNWHKNTQLQFHVLNNWAIWTYRRPANR